jgi:hypothetical protein
MKRVVSLAGIIAWCLATNCTAWNRADGPVPAPGYAPLPDARAVSRVSQWPTEEYKRSRRPGIPPDDPLTDSFRIPRSGRDFSDLGLTAIREFLISLPHEPILSLH